MSGIEVVSLPQFSIALLVTSLQYAISRLLGPDHTLGSAINLETYFYEIKTPFLMCLFGAPLVSMLMLSSGDAAETNPITLAAIFASILLPLVGVFTANRRAHAVIVVLWSASYALQETLQSAVGQP